MKWFTVAPLVLAASTPQATQMVTMSGISLQLPAAWTVKTDGHYALMASLSATFDQAVMPWVTIIVCDDSENHRCPARPLDLAKDKTCRGLQRSIHEWPNGISETRWVCPRMRDHPGVRYSSAVTQFEVGRRKLLMYYLATDHDTPPTMFLDEFAKALQPNDP